MKHDITLLLAWSFILSDCLHANTKRSCLATSLIRMARLRRQHVSAEKKDGKETVKEQTGKTGKGHFEVLL